MVYARTDDVNVNLLLAHFFRSEKMDRESVNDIVTKSIELIGREIFILSDSLQSTRIAKYEAGACSFKKIEGRNTHRKTR